MNRVTSKAIGEQVVALGAVLLLTSVFVASPAAAQTFDDAANSVLGFLTGGFIRTIAVIAVIVSGLAAYLGRASWGIFYAAVGGTVIMFSAEWVVDLVSGGL